MMNNLQLLFMLLIPEQISTYLLPSLVVVPSRSQFFEYEMVSLSCEQTGSADWTVWRYSESGSELSPCRSGWGDLGSASTCQLANVKPYHSGVYWCESALRDSSQAVHVQVTEGSVVLDSPVVPVMVGQDATLRCRSRTMKNITAEFFKNGVLMKAEPSDHMIIRHVSRSDEAVYKCRISGQGESLSSWLLVRDDSSPMLLTVSPDVSQLFEYDSLILSCGANSSAMGWTIRRFTNAPPRRSGTCGQQWGSPVASGCRLNAVKKRDGAVYWCESRSMQRSNSLNISVFDSSVILQSPVLPVMEGDNVTLTCRTKSSVFPSSFFKDGALISSESSNQLTLHQVSGADGGEYSCSITGQGESAPSQLSVRGSSGAYPGSDLTVTQLVLMVTRYLVVCSPYAVSTVLLVSLSRHKPARREQPVAMTTPSPNEEDEGLDQQYDDVTTEHDF
ncbi:basement membrane-specific heparan sulfate proteoglycan core protein-like isoform X2 [Salarias fasciatus]|uniref:basement membrane-specific heparan sulfate proteoglycan core protein-like isoform X2 n=2 Tax=Salarias fasciatus TaxID=181472 RepID=UPI00117664A4|nr:basement membrane-specific heparan sulfate proteoglycan core protein-like isoform X2 [Salarias fasciatus]